jgi:hypothetical protein
MTLAVSGFSFAANGYGQGARVAPVTATFTAADGTCTVNLQQLAPNQQLGNISCLYIDNSAGPIPIVVQFPDTEMRIDVAAFTQGFFPVFTNSQVFNVLAPLIAVLGVAFTVPIQVLNFAVQPSQSTQLPNLNAGSEIAVGNSAGWTSYFFYLPGSGLIYTAMTVDNSKFSSPVTIQGVGINGAAWTFTQQPFTNSETTIPPSVAGSAALATTSLFPPTTVATTEALIPVTFRVAPAGLAASTSLPAAIPAFAVPVASGLVAGNNNFPVAIPAGFGAFIGSLTITAAAVSTALLVSLVDESLVPLSPVFVFAQVAIPAGSSSISVPVDFTSYGRGGSIVARFTCTALTTWAELGVQITLAAVNASQNG